MKFELDKSYSEACILNDAYIRGMTLINKGEVIRNPSAWLRTTTYNIIRERKREQQKLTSFDESFAESQSSLTNASVSSDILEHDLTVLRTAFEALEGMDKLLLSLKVVEGRSWREIRELLKLQGFADYTEETLRKRKERALIRLRKLFHAINPSEFPE